MADPKDVLKAMMIDDDAPDAPSDAVYSPMETSSAASPVEPEAEAVAEPEVVAEPEPEPKPEAPAAEEAQPEDAEVAAATGPAQAEPSLSPHPSFHGVSAGDITFSPDAAGVSEERADSPVRDTLRTLMKASAAGIDAAETAETAEPSMSPARKDALDVQATLRDELETAAVRDTRKTPPTLPVPGPEVTMRPVPPPAAADEGMAVHQLVDGDLKYKGFDAFLTKYNMYNKGYDYNMLGVFGGQSTGKSTLLNRLFNTKFQEMDSSSGRSQTTQGVWMSGAASSNRLIVLDFEGADSGQREDESFEKKLALFALAMADVLVINLFQTEIGRKNAMSVPLLEKVLQINFDIQIQLLNNSTTSQKGAKKMILFIIRDYDGNTPQHKLYTQLSIVMAGIWDRVVKPEQYEEDDMEKWFDFSFECLPHINNKDGFMERVGELRSRLTNEDDKEFVFKQEGGDWRSSGVPIDGLDGYANSCWEAIVHNRDINIPGEKELVARHRATEAASKAKTEFGKEMEKLQRQQSSAVNADVTPLPRATSLVRHAVDAAVASFDHDVQAFSRYAAVLGEARKLLQAELEEASGATLKALLYNPLCKKISKPMLTELAEKLNHLTESFNYKPSNLWDFLRQGHADLKERLIVAALDRLQGEGVLDADGRNHCSIELQKQLLDTLRQNIEVKACGVNKLMADRFLWCLLHNQDGLALNIKEADLEKRGHDAFLAAMDVLKGLALWQMEEEFVCVIGHPEYGQRATLPAGARALTEVVERDARADFFIIPAERVETVYNVFLSDLERKVLEAKMGLKNKVVLPPWVYMTFLVLGFDEAYWLITNPLLIILFCFLTALFAKAYVTMWFEDAMENGHPAVQLAVSQAWPHVQKFLALIPDKKPEIQEKDADAKKKD